MKMFNARINIRETKKSFIFLPKKQFFFIAH